VFGNLFGSIATLFTRLTLMLYQKHVRQYRCCQERNVSNVPESNSLSNVFDINCVRNVFESDSNTVDSVSDSNTVLLRRLTVTLCYKGV
jgi:hypothetical protein